MDAGSILGLPDLRPPFLDDVPAAEKGRAEARDGVTVDPFTLRYNFQDDDDDSDPDDDDFDEDSDEDDDDEPDEDEPETWQVLSNAVALKYGLSLTSAPDVPRLTPIFQLY